jgi:Bacterial DNA-binding protein
MSRFWRVDKALEGSEGLRWIRERLGAYDWSKADWVSVRRGRSETYAFRGVCKMPRDGSGYRINCNVSEHAAYPIYQRMRVSPLYRNPDGTWPKAPEGHKAGEEVQITGFGTFSVRERKAREGRNPQTGQKMKIAAQKVPAFSAGNVLKQAV